MQGDCNVVVESRESDKGCEENRRKEDGHVFTPCAQAPWHVRQVLRRASPVYRSRYVGVCGGITDRGGGGRVSRGHLSLDMKLRSSYEGDRQEGGESVFFSQHDVIGKLCP